MTPNDAANPPYPPRRRPVWFVVLLLCGVLMWAAWSMVEWRNGVVGDVLPIATGTMRYDQTAGAGDGAEVMFGLLASPQSAEGLRLNPAHRPLDREPAGLPPVPGAEHLSRYRIAEGGLTDEVSYWWVDDAEVKRIAGHYHREATARGWVPLQATDAAGQTARLYLDPEGGGRVLTVRVAERGGRHHVTLWLRYESTGGGGTPRP